jgi:hypothetical protein
MGAPASAVAATPRTGTRHADRQEHHCCCDRAGSYEYSIAHDASLLVNYEFTTGSLPQRPEPARVPTNDRTILAGLVLLMSNSTVVLTAKALHRFARLSAFRSSREVLILRGRMSWQLRSECGGVFRRI